MQAQFPQFQIPSDADAGESELPEKIDNSKVPVLQVDMALQTTRCYADSLHYLVVESLCVSLLTCIRVCMQATRELGIVPLPVEETLIDMAVTLIQLGIVKPKLK